MDRLIKNSIRTPDGTVITADRDDDYKSYTDANGKVYYVLGVYSQLNSNHDDQEDLSIHLDNTPYEECRTYPIWGTYGKCGTLPYKRISVSEMDDAHMHKILEYSNRLDDIVKTLIEAELAYRRISKCS